MYPPITHASIRPLTFLDQETSLPVLITGVLIKLRYSHLFDCDNFILSDYSHSVAFHIPHETAADQNCPMEAQECGGAFAHVEPPKDDKITNSPLSYGFRCTLFYMIWHSLQHGSVISIYLCHCYLTRFPIYNAASRGNLLQEELLTRDQ